MNELVHNDQVVQELSRAIAHGIAQIKYVPDMILDVVNHDRWRRRVLVSGEVVTFDRFKDFVETLPLEGLGTDVSTLTRICTSEGRADAVDAIDRALKAEERRGPLPQSEDSFVDNVHETIERPTGNHAAAALRRLRDQRPDLHKAVIEGKMSANEAAIIAGFRKRKIQVYPDDPENTARLLLKHMGTAGVEELQVCLDKILGDKRMTDD